MIVFLVARGVALLALRLAERRGRKRPPEGRDDELVPEAIDLARRAQGPPRIVVHPDQ